MILLADVLVRVKNGRKLAVRRRLPDGSYLSTLGTLRVRVVYCEITIATTNCCAPPSRTRPAPQPAPIRTVPASASPGRPRGISSSKPRT
jgi:hypothetical protein